MKPLKELTRPNIWNLAPYSCARNEYSGKEASVFIDANENPYNTPFNRYPDPLQLELKARISAIKGVPAENIFLGNGSDEAIDLVYRCFTNPGKDNVVAIEPTYGMYHVCADINDVEYRTALLDDKFQLNADAVLAACDNNTKVIWLCSPNNPTGNNLDRDAMIKIINSFDALVVVDEAYGDFTQIQPIRTELAIHPNLIVLNTMSKAWACAGLRLGMAFASKEIINIFNKVKYPYNVNSLAQQKALEMLQDPYQVDSWVHTLIMERDRVIEAFRLLPTCEEVYPTDANFFLAKMTDATGIYNYLVDNGIIVRNRTNVTLCNNCLRITVGTRSENMKLLSALRNMHIS